MENKNNSELQIQQINEDVIAKVSSLKKSGTIETLAIAQQIYENMISEKLGIVNKDKMPNLLQLRKRNFLIFFIIFLILFADVFWALSSIMKQTDSYLSTYWLIYYIYLVIGLYAFWFCYFKNPLKQLSKALKMASKKLVAIS